MPNQSRVGTLMALIFHQEESDFGTVGPKPIIGVINDLAFIENGKFDVCIQLWRYLPETAGSRPISEVNPIRAHLVLSFVRTWEYLGAVTFCQFL